MLFAKIFAWLPVETLVKENQEEYYKVLSASDGEADSTKFIELLLARTVDEIVENEKKVTQKVTQKVTVNQKKY